MAISVGQDFTLDKSLFRTVKLTKNAYPDKNKYSSYDIGFDTNVSFSLFDGNGFGKNVIIFGTDMSSSGHIDNKKKDPTQGFDNTTLTAEKYYYYKLYGATEAQNFI